MLGEKIRFFCPWMIAAIIIGVTIRLIIGGLLSYNYDVFSWALIISNIQAGSGLYDVTGYNYPPVWGYILGLVAQLTDLFGMDVLAERFPDLIFTESEIANNPHLAFTTTVEFNVLMAGVIAIFDILASYLIYYVIREVFKDDRKAILGAALWMLCPFIIAVGSAGVMFDCLSGALALLCVILLIKDQEFLAGSIFAVAVFLKFFPAFLIFILIAYIFVKHREDFPMRLGKAALGAAIFTAVIMVPQIMDGHLLDSGSFLLSRATVSTNVFDQYGTIIAYAVAIILEIVLAWYFTKRKSENLDRDFLFFSFIAALLTLIYPSSSQYVLFMAPFLIITALCVDGRYRVGLAIITVGTTIYVLGSSAALLTSVMEYTDLISFSSWFAFDTWLLDTKVLGLNMYNFISGIGGFLQYSAILICYYFIAKTFIYREREFKEDGFHH